MLKTTMSLVDKKTKAITDFNLYHGYLPKHIVKNYCFVLKIINTTYIVFNLFALKL